jgi:hypothetical protein
VTVIQLLERLENLIERDNSIKYLPVEMLIEFAAIGQVQASCNDVALSAGKYVVLIYEEGQADHES